MPIHPVHFLRNLGIRRPQQSLYSINDLLELPVRNSAFPSGFFQVVGHVLSAVLGKALVWKGLQVLLGPQHMPA